jgi:hypothetical protein
VLEVWHKWGVTYRCVTGAVQMGVLQMWYRRRYRCAAGVIQIGYRCAAGVIQIGYRRFSHHHSYDYAAHRRTSGLTS